MNPAAPITPKNKPQADKKPFNKNRKKFFMQTLINLLIAFSIRNKTVLKQGDYKKNF
ncbi:Uncharacterised protein [Chlamydia trachomatis]|nr:Uncharacterised protein [Chlamydia trachomatis]